MYLHNTPDTQLFLLPYRAHALFLTHQASLAIVPFWYGGIEAWLGVFFKNQCYPIDAIFVPRKPITFGETTLHEALHGTLIGFFHKPLRVGMRVSRLLRSESSRRASLRISITNGEGDQGNPRIPWLPGLTASPRPCPVRFPPLPVPSVVFPR